MEMNRNQWFMIGIIVFLIGLQFRMVSTYQLNEETTRILAERAGKTALPNPLPETSPTLFNFDSPTPMPVVSRKVIQLPEWSGWCLMSVGSVMILHSLAMRRPD